MKHYGIRTHIAICAGQCATFASRILGKGAGGMIGGVVAHKIDPHIVEKVSRPMNVALVTGTNGKSTTTKMLHAAVSTLGETAWNSRGDNMLSGITTALFSRRHARYATLEVDEMYTAQVAGLTQPDVFILLNLSRDQLDRVGEITHVEARIRAAVESCPDATIVANCDDPLIASAAWDCPNVIWVAAGCGWTIDSTVFPRSGKRVHYHDDGTWYVDETYRRPRPHWFVENNTLVYQGDCGKRGDCEERYPLHLRIPGVVNQRNAAQAVAGAVALGVPAAQAVHAVETVAEVAGRYARYDVHGRHLRMFLAKNPAGWQQALTMVSSRASSVIFAINGQVADGQDLSWLWDVDFEQGCALPESTAVYACGERGADLAVRVHYAGIQAHLRKTPMEAVLAAEPGDIDVLANYTAFRDFKALLEKEGFRPCGEVRA